MKLFSPFKRILLFYIESLCYTIKNKSTIFMLLKSFKPKSVRKIGKRYDQKYEQYSLYVVIFFAFYHFDIIKKYKSIPNLILKKLSKNEQKIH